MNKRILTKKRNAVLLFADDSSVFRRTLLKFLKTEYKSAQIIETQNGVEALEKTKEYIPDIILLDINMMDMSGLNVTEKIKKEFPFIPIIILTNYEEMVYRQEAKKLQADAFIVKKKLASELVPVINTLLLN